VTSERAGWVPAQTVIEVALLVRQQIHQRCLFQNGDGDEV
jgi:hypothetical protein